MPKLTHWIDKKRFKFSDECDGQIGLQVSDLFDFCLKKKTKTDVQKI